MSSVHPSEDTPLEEAHNERTGTIKEDKSALVVDLPEIPTADLSFEFSSFMDPASVAEVEKIQKRASNVMKMAEENEKLKAELKAMTDRLEAAERRREQLKQKEQKVMEEPSS